MSRLLWENDPANPRLYEAFYILIESTSLQSIPEKIELNSQTFYFSVLETIF